MGKSRSDRRSAQRAKRRSAQLAKMQDVAEKPEEGAENREDGYWQTTKKSKKRESQIKKQDELSGSFISCGGVCGSSRKVCTKIHDSTETCPYPHRAKYPDALRGFDKTYLNFCTNCVNIVDKNHIDSYCRDYCGDCICFDPRTCMYYISTT